MSGLARGATNLNIAQSMQMEARKHQRPQSIRSGEDLLIRQIFPLIDLGCRLPRQRPSHQTQR